MEFRKLSKDRKRDWREQPETRLFLRELKRLQAVETRHCLNLAAEGEGHAAAYSSGMEIAYGRALVLSGAEEPEDEHDQGIGDDEEADDGE